MYFTECDIIYHIDQDFFMSRFEQILSDAEFHKLAFMRMKLIWIANTTLDTVFEISQISQVTRGIYEKDINKHC